MYDVCGRFFFLISLFLALVFSSPRFTLSQGQDSHILFAGFLLSDGFTLVDRNLDGPDAYFALEGDSIIPVAVIRNFTPVPETTFVQLMMFDIIGGGLAYEDSLQVVLPPSMDVTVKLSPWVIPFSPMSKWDRVILDGSYNGVWRKGDGEMVELRPLRSGRCGFVQMNVVDQGDGSFRITKKIVNRKSVSCPWTISYWWDNFGVNAGTRNFISSASDSLGVGMPPVEITSKWVPPGSGKYCVFAKTTVQGKSVLEYINKIRVRNPQPPPPFPPPPPPPPPPPGWQPLPPGRWWHMNVPVLSDSTVAPQDSTMVELVALSLQGASWPFVLSKDTIYVKYADTNNAYLSVYVPDSIAPLDSSVFTVVAKEPYPGGLELGSVTFIIAPEASIGTASISGMKFNDLNGDGIQDTSEGALPGWQIVLSGAVVETTITDSNGFFSFDNLPSGDYCIHEIQQMGWTQTHPDSFYCITLTSGEIVDSLNFGNIFNPVSVEELSEQIPKEYALYQNYPNPFNSTTRISFDLPSEANVTLSIYNSIGQIVAVLIEHQQISAGKHSFEFDGSKLTTGVYFYRIKANHFSNEKALIIMK